MIHWMLCVRPTAKRREEPTTWCPQCGYGAKVDEDGCCAACGSTATGKGVDQAIAARRRSR